MGVVAHARLSDPGRSIRGSRQGDLAASARAKGRGLGVGRSPPSCLPRADDARGGRAQVRSAASPGMGRADGSKARQIGYFLRSLRISFNAACLLRLDWASTSRTSPSASTARHR